MSDKSAGITGLHIKGSTHNDTHNGIYRVEYEVAFIIAMQMRIIGCSLKLLQLHAWMQFKCIEFLKKNRLPIGCSGN